MYRLPGTGTSLSNKSCTQGPASTVPRGSRRTASSRRQLPCRGPSSALESSAMTHSPEVGDQSVDRLGFAQVDHLDMIRQSRPGGRKPRSTRLPFPARPGPARRGSQRTGKRRNSIRAAPSGRFRATARRSAAPEASGPGSSRGSGGSSSASSRSFSASQSARSFKVRL